MKAIEDPKWRARLLVPLSVFMMIIGLGMIIPGGGVLIGAMPLFVGLWLLAKGLGAETQFERLIVDMRESAMGGIVSSLLWAFASFASLLAILEVYREIAQASSEMSGFEIGVEAMDSGLQWIVLASLAVAMSMVVLRWRRGTLSGRIFQLVAGGAVIYAFAEASLDVARKIAQGETYELDPGVIYSDWGLVLVTIVVWWMVRTGVRSWSTRQEIQGKFWGV